MRQKVQPHIGDECWFVQWTYELVWVDDDSVSEYREINRDKCKVRTRKVPTKEHAERLAKAVWPETKNAFGFVEYWHARYEAYDDCDEPYLASWRPTAEHSEIYEGD